MSRGGGGRSITLGEREKRGGLPFINRGLRSSFGIMPLGSEMLITVNRVAGPPSTVIACNLPPVLPY